jgi:hypothetical protein
MQKEGNMFSWYIHSTWDGSKFILTVPLHQKALLIAGFFLLIGLLYLLKSGHWARNALYVAGVILAYGFLMYSSELTFDRTNGTATLKTFQFYHWSTSTYPLDHIDRIYVSTGSTTSMLKIQFTDGSTTSIDFLDQTGGKDQVAYAANQWLGHAQ